MTSGRETASFESESIAGEACLFPLHVPLPQYPHNESDGRRGGGEEREREREREREMVCYECDFILRKVAKVPHCTNNVILDDRTRK